MFFRFKIEGVTSWYRSRFLTPLLLFCVMPVFFKPENIIFTTATTWRVLQQRCNNFVLNNRILYLLVCTISNELNFESFLVFFFSFYHCDTLNFSVSFTWNVYPICMNIFVFFHHHWTKIMQTEKHPHFVSLSID